MRIISWLVLTSFLISSSVSAQTALPQNVVPAPVTSAKVGVAAGVKGEVQLARNGGVGQVVSSGAEIYLGDKISTDAKGGLQILLLDQTTFTIGSNSSIVVDQFIYDPTTDAGKVSVRVVEGTFRFITGKIAHKNPENMQVDLPNGTIGIRGTMVMGRVDGMKSLAVLTGPGDKNNTGSKRGEIVVGGKGDDTKFVRIAKTGFGTEIEGEGAPKMPFQVPQAQLDEMTSELSPKSGEDEASGEEKSDSSGEGEAGSEESATEQAGQEAVDTDGDLTTTVDIPTPETFNVPPPSEIDCADNDSSCATATIFEGITTFQQLNSITTGTGHYDAGGDLFAAGVDRGDFSLHMYIDFGQHKILEDAQIAGFYDLDGGGALPNRNFLFDIGGSTGVLFSTMTQGDAIFSFSAGIPNTHGGPDICGTCTLAPATITVLNAGSEIAKNLKVDVTIADSGTPVVSGSDISTDGH